VRLLEEKDIPVLPFKGAVLAAVAYRNLSLRQFADLDILVRKRNVARTKKILEQQGYRIAVPLTILQRVSPVLSSRKDVVLVNLAGDVRIELHWRLTGRHFSFPIGAKSLWHGRDTRWIAGTCVRTLPPKELLLYLCMHGSRHSWERLGWICDVAEMVRVHSNWDWQQIIKEASELGNERNLALGLYLANDLLGAELPEEVLEKVRADPKIEALATQVRSLLFQDVAASLDIAYLHDYHLKVKERMRDRIRLRLHYYRRYLSLAVRPTMQDRNALPLFGYFYFLSYVTRPFRLIGVYGSGILARLFRQSKKAVTRVLPPRSRKRFS
jgi:hypothetical protein